MMPAFIDRLRAVAAVYTQEPMANHTTFRIGGPAEILIRAESISQLAQILRLSQEFQIPYFLLGGGSNILVSDRGIRGLVVENRARVIREEATPFPDDTTLLWAESGTPLAKLARHTMQQGLGGLEWAVGIPGTVGGAIVYNAGAHGHCIAEVLERVRLLEADGSIQEEKATDLCLSYRTSSLNHSREGKGRSVLAARFALRSESAAEMEQRVATYTAWRRSSQPRMASAGSIFKNPPGYSAGWLIERAGLKGQRIGDAQISEKHANFIVNRGAAKALEVRKLMELARERVQREFDIELELEIELVGEWGLAG